jgi:hypothetical protein
LGWYCTVRKTSLIFSYGMNWITVTKTVHIHHICILCNWKCKWHGERNRRTKMRIRRGLIRHSTLSLLPPTPLRNYHKYHYVQMSPCLSLPPSLFTLSVVYSQMWWLQKDVTF